MRRPGTDPARPGDKLRTRIEETPNELRVTWAGAIDESSNLEGVFAKLTRDALFNMRDVERVNSMGVHQWIPLVTRFSAKHRLVIDEISYALVQNANVVANLFGTARVRSCMAPYFCAACKININLSVAREEALAASDEPPAKQCPRCGSALEFDELDGYFQFFKTRARTS